MKLTNLVFLRRNNQILLAMKKRGFGVGKINGVGGKAGKDESIEAAAIREAGEEISVTIDVKDLIKVAEIKFCFKDQVGWDIHCDIFFTYKWIGEPVESEEMLPSWYELNEIHYDKMWVDDKYWLPIVLSGKKIKAEFWFLGTGEKMDKYDIQEWVC